MSNEELPQWRQKSITLLSLGLSSESVALLEEAMYQHLSLEHQSEDRMRNDSPIFQNIYCYRIRDLVLVLDPASEVYQAWIPDQLEKGKLAPERLVSMKPWEMCPEAWREAREDYENELENMSVTQQSTSNMFFCVKCHKKETTYYEEQTRSSDEPMTTYITCTNCGHHWKQ